MEAIELDQGLKNQTTVNLTLSKWMIRNEKERTQLVIWGAEKDFFG